VVKYLSTAQTLAGKTIYQWDGPESSQPDVPRQPPPDDIAGISEGMRNLPIEDHPYDTHQGEGYTHTGSSKSKSKSSKSKSKGKQREQRNDYEQGEYSNDDPSYQHTQGGGQQSYAQDTSRQDAYQDPGSSYFQDPSGSVGQGYDPTTGGYYQCMYFVTTPCISDELCSPWKLKPRHRPI
jgi:hypothetical protein